MHFFVSLFLFFIVVYSLFGTMSCEEGEEGGASEKKEFIEYKTTTSVSYIGHRVRRHNSSTSDDIGTIPHNSTARISIIEGDWGKLHHSMYDGLQKNLHHVSHNCVREGWILLKDDNHTYFEQGRAEGDPVNPTPYIAATIGGVAAAGVAGGVAVASGGFALLGLNAAGPIAGGWFAANMGAGVAAGSMMASLQSYAMGTAAYVAAGVGAGGISGAASTYAYRWKMTG